MPTPHKVLIVEVGRNLDTNLPKSFCNPIRSLTQHYLTECVAQSCAIPELAKPSEFRSWTWQPFSYNSDHVHLSVFRVQLSVFLIFFIYTYHILFVYLFMYLFIYLFICINIYNISVCVHTLSYILPHVHHLNHPRHLPTTLLQGSQWPPPAAEPAAAWSPAAPAAPSPGPRCCRAGSDEAPEAPAEMLEMYGCQEKTSNIKQLYYRMKL